MHEVRARKPHPGRTHLPGALGILVCVALGAVLARQLTKRVEARGFELVDPARVRLDPGLSAGPIDPRWEQELAAALANVAPLWARDAEARDALAARIAALPFVAEVGEPRSVWPDGLSVPVRLRRAVACVPTAALFLSVAEDGVVLPGAHVAPPWAGERWLPVVGPRDGGLDLALPGEVLVEERHLDALSIALSMEEHLAPVRARQLGRVVIDASTSPSTSLEEPGALLLLEDRRVIVFGRAPRQGAPGSAPPEHKWDGIARALACLATGDPRLDWETADVRFVPDVDVLWRDGSSGALPTWQQLETWQ